MKDLPLGPLNHLQSRCLPEALWTLGPASWKAAWQRETRGSWWTPSWPQAISVPLSQTRPTGYWAAFRLITASRWREILLLYSAQLRQTWSAVSHSVPNIPEQRIGTSPTKCHRSYKWIGASDVWRKTECCIGQCVEEKGILRGSYW